LQRRCARSAVSWRTVALSSGSAPTVALSVATPPRVPIADCSARRTPSRASSLPIRPAAPASMASNLLASVRRMEDEAGAQLGAHASDDTTPDAGRAGAIRWCTRPMGRQAHKEPPRPPRPLPGPDSRCGQRRRSAQHHRGDTVRRLAEYDARHQLHHLDAAALSRLPTSLSVSAIAPVSIAPRTQKRRSGAPHSRPREIRCAHSLRGGTRAIGSSALDS
jgi:hypothetical protein